VGVWALQLTLHSTCNLLTPGGAGSGSRRERKQYVAVINRKKKKISIDETAPGALVAVWQLD
jgi:hypothetical protein